MPGETNKVLVPGFGYQAKRECPIFRGGRCLENQAGYYGTELYSVCIFPPSKLIMEITMETLFMHQKSIFHLDFC